MGYAGYYDLANASGIALANGVARWLCLAQGGPETQAQLDDFRRTLADSLIKDICYKNDVKIELDAYIRGELGGDPDNFCRSGTDPDVVLTKARQLLDESAAPCSTISRTARTSPILTAAPPASARFPSKT